MIELTIRIHANSLGEALSELKTVGIEQSCETTQQPVEIHLSSSETECETKETKEESEERNEETTIDEEATQEEPKEIKPEEVRAILVKAREAGVDLVSILEPYGGRFPDVKPADYAALLKDAQEALANVVNG